MSILFLSQSIKNSLSQFINHLGLPVFPAQSQRHSARDFVHQCICVFLEGDFRDRLALVWDFSRHAYIKFTSSF